MKHENRTVADRTRKDKMFEMTRLPEYKELLNGSDKFLSRLRGELEKKDRKFICQMCPHFNGGGAYSGWCNKADDHAYEVRNSLVRCKHMKMNPEHYSFGYYNTKTKKHKIVHDGEKLRRERERKEKFKYYMKLIKGIIDSIRVNDFYPLKAAFRGEPYELKKKISEGDGGRSSEAKDPEEIRTDETRPESQERSD